MRYGIPTGYKSKLTKRQTLQYVFVTTEKLVANLLSSFKGLVIDVPQAVAADSKLQPDAAGRPISFDTIHSAKVHSVLTDPDNYLAEAVSFFQPKFNTVLLARGIYVKRDSQVSNIDGVCVQQIHMEGRIVVSDAIDWLAFLQERAQKMFEVLRITANQTSMLFENDIFLTSPYLINVEHIKKQFWSQGANGAIGLACQKYKLVFIQTPFLLYEDFGKSREAAAIDPKRHLSCYLYADSCESPLLLFDVGIRPGFTAETPSPLLNKDHSSQPGKKDSFLSVPTPTYFIRVNVSHLLMALLKKVHVAEVVASVWSDDFIKHCRAIGLDIL